MLKNKASIFIISLMSIVIFAHKIFAQDLEIGGSASFSYSTSDDTGKTLAVQDSDETFTQSYSLNIKNNLTDNGTMRSAVRYSIDNSLKTRGEATDLSVDVSYDRMAFSIALRDDMKSDFDAFNISNNKSSSFSFQLNPEVLPKFSFSYRNSVKDNEMSSASDSNTFGLQFSKNIKVQNSNISAAVSYNDNRDNLSGKQTTDERFNMNYGVKLFDDKLSLSSGYRVGSNNDVNTSVNNLTESGDLSLGFNLLNNLTINGDWSKSSNFSSDKGKKDVRNTNGFRLNFIPIPKFTLGASIKFDENQKEDLIDKSTSKDFSARMPPIFDVINIGYSYNNKETKDTLTAGDSIDFSFDFGSLKISNFTSSAKYGKRKRQTFESNTMTQDENFGFNLSGQPVNDFNFTYSYSLDKSNSNLVSDNKEAIRNALTLSYNLKLIEDLSGTVGTTYGLNQNVSASSSSVKTDNSYNGNLNYRLGETNLTISGSLTRSFDETGEHVSQRSDVGPGISTKVQDLTLSARAAFGEDSSAGEVNSSNVNYSLAAGYPIGTVGTSSLSYTVTNQENLKTPSANKDSERVSINVSLNF